MSTAAKKSFITLLAITTGFLGLRAQSTITIHGNEARDTISKNIYGHFAEHLGHCIYGGFYVGTGNTQIPNTNGIRTDIVNALKKLKAPILRWPGGCFADIYHWKDGVGPKNKRKPIENMWWGNVKEDNSFGTHEFLELCDMINAEPYLALNVGSGTVEEAADWVKYVNHPNGSGPMSDLRVQNGRKQPWKVKFWGVGNESWDCGGHMTVDYYINQFNRYATFMTDYNNSEGLFRIAVGPGTEDFAWTEALMKNIPRKLLDGVSIHHYSVINWSKKSSATAYSEDEYFSTMKQAYRMDTIVSGNAAVMDKYDPQKKVALVVDEWGGWYDTEPGTNGAFLYQQNTMRDAMIAGITLNIFNNHCDRVRIANLAQCINVLQAVILTNKEKMILTPTYHVMEMYNVHQNALLLPVTVNSSDYTLGDQKLKAVSASASKDRNGVVHISLVNIDSRQAQKVNIALGSLGLKTVTGRILQSAHLQDHNTFENPDKVKPVAFNGASLKGGSLELTIPAFSVIVLELK
jgi:alpha-N-arabinofuranosidase